MNLEKTKIKCVLLDIDGTLTNEKNEVSDYTKKVIKNLVDKDIKVVLVSGRNIDSVVKVSKECNANCIVIANNGAVIYDYCKCEFLFFEKFPPGTVKKIFNLCLTYNIDSIYNSLDLRYRNHKCLDNRYDEKNDVIMEMFKDIKSDIYQIVLLGTNFEKFSQCINRIEEYGLKASNTAKGSNGITFADINLMSTSKGEAVKKLKNLLNVEKDNIICFGDSMNDIEMFKECGIRVAMKNAIDNLKECADYITEYSNDEDGVARFLKNYFR